MKHCLISKIVIKMKKILKLSLSFIGIVICFVAIIRGGAYSNIFLLILIAVSIYFGIVYGQRKKDKEETKSSVPTVIPNIPKEFKDEQEKFKQLNEPRGLEK